MKRMSVYALIESDFVVNIVLWDGNVETWTPPEGQLAVECPEHLAVTIGSKYINSEFVLEPPRQIPESTPEEILQMNTALRDAYLSVAALAIAPLQDAVDLGEATTDESVSLLKWKKYRIAVNRVDVSTKGPGWPEQPVP